MGFLRDSLTLSRCLWCDRFIQAIGSIHRWMLSSLKLLHLKRAFFAKETMGFSWVILVLLRWPRCSKSHDFILADWTTLCHSFSNTQIKTQGLTQCVRSVSKVVLAVPSTSLAFDTAHLPNTWALTALKICSALCWFLFESFLRSCLKTLSTVRYGAVPECAHKCTRLLLPLDRDTVLVLNWSL